MTILQVLQLPSVNEIDPLRPIEVLGVTLGLEATAAAIDVTNNGSAFISVEVVARSLSHTLFFELVRDGVQVAKVFGFSASSTQPLPTAVEVAIVAVEVAIVHALHIDALPDPRACLDGGNIIIVRTTNEVGPLNNIMKVIEQPLCGKSVMSNGGYTATIHGRSDDCIRPIVVECFKSSFQCAPIKFRFIELYRVMESRFIQSIIDKVNASYLSSPRDALQNGLDRLSSELKQLIMIAEESQVYFERLRNRVFSSLDNGNAFASELVKKLRAKAGADYASYWKSGAYLVYYIRCAVVHAGDKDLVYESFADCDVLIEGLIQDMEMAALSCCGIDLV